MKDFFKILKRFIPPYKGKLIWNILFNFLSAMFGAFSFLLIIPSLKILFGTQDLVTQKPEFGTNVESITNYANYYISYLIKTYSHEKALIFIGLFLILAVLLKVGFDYLSNYMLIFIRNGVVRDIRQKIYNKILQLPLGFFSEERKGDIIARITGDVTEVENSIMSSLENMIKNPILIIVSIVIMIYMSWNLTLFVFIMFPIAGYLIGAVGKSLKRRSRKGQAKMGEILSIIEEDLSGLRVIKSFNAEKMSINRFSTQNNNYFTIMNQLMWRRSLAHPMSEFMGTAVIVIVLWYGGRLILNENSSLDAASFIGYLIFFYNIINPAKAFSAAFYNIEKGLASMERIDRILTAKNDIVEKNNPIRINSFENAIQYQDVSFAYDKEKVLKDINLTVKKGETVAFVGRSGSGKTTLVDLLPRFWDVSNGMIKIDEHNVRDLRLKDIRNLIGYVNQEPILFNDTFFNNIALGCDNATQEEVENAARIANAHDFIVETENGYQTRIGTSSLDTESERLVQDALDKLMQNRTSLVIAHRLSTIKHANFIYVLHKGKVVEKGTHEELIKKEGRYKKLHSMQMF